MSWLNEKEAIEYTKLSRKILYDARQTGKLYFCRKDRKISYEKAELDKFLLSLNNPNISSK